MRVRVSRVRAQYLNIYRFDSPRARGRCRKGAVNGSLTAPVLLCILLFFMFFSLVSLCWETLTLCGRVFILLYLLYILLVVGVAVGPV
nr:MAG TPA: hypothetical protein [Microviridae sp.]